MTRVWRDATEVSTHYTQKSFKQLIMTSPKVQCCVKLLSKGHSPNWWPLTSWVNEKCSYIRAEAWPNFLFLAFIVPYNIESGLHGDYHLTGDDTQLLSVWGLLCHVSGQWTKLSNLGPLIRWQVEWIGHLARENALVLYNFGLAIRYLDWMRSRFSSERMEYSCSVSEV